MSSMPIDYARRLTPAFDAVEDVKSWLGQERWDKVSPEMAKVNNCAAFAMYAGLAGVRGYPVVAWYELYHGQGSWKQRELDEFNGKTGSEA